MNNTIIGTAGHVDHGKTTLIKALTGVDTDRLKEEKKRGITIELGFAYLELPNGEKAGIIDVPGHEKFIKNMLAGAGSVDVALLVVAADEGFMPQTREHLGILGLLGIARGVIALTKVDLVDDEWKELVLLDIEEEVKGTFLEGAPVIPLSAHTGEGVEALQQCLFDLLLEAPAKVEHVPFRLPVDRVFSVDGFGTVVTGTLTEGRLQEGDTIVVFPCMQTTKARNIQVHGKDALCAYAGQRVAVNLAGLKHTQVERGDTLAAPHSMQNSNLLDVRLDILADTEREIRNNSRLHLYHGTKDVLCRVVLLDSDVLEKGQSAYAQLRLQAPLAARCGDRFVVRFYSPLETVGGGVIYNPAASRHRRGDHDPLRHLHMLEKGTLRERIACMVLLQSQSFPTLQDIRRKLFGEDPRFDGEAAQLLEEGVLLKASGACVIHRDYLQKVGQACEEILAQYHEENPLKAGMRRDELWVKLLSAAEPSRTESAMADKLIDLLVEKGFVRLEGNLVANNGFAVTMSERHKKLTDAIINTFLDAGVETPSLEEVAAQFGKEKKAFKQALDSLVESGTLVVLTPQIALHTVHYQNALQTFRSLALQQGEVTLGQFRDALGTSRKYALALLEHFDRKRITRKQGEARRLL